MDTPYTTDWAADQLGVTPKWLRARVAQLGVPHLRLARNRMAFTPEQYAALLKALEVSSHQPTDRSRARQRKGRAA